MESYIVRIYRRAGKKARILIGTVETAGTRRKIAFSNIEELWEVLKCRKGGNRSAPLLPTLRPRKEVMDKTAETDLPKSSPEGVRKS